jgi:hypothetical protein
MKFHSLQLQLPASALSDSADGWTDGVHVSIDDTGTSYTTDDMLSVGTNIRNNLVAQCYFRSANISWD